jgi:ABC-type Zn uptake system ZnuABC Zn-binding protein ZnuA
MKDKLIKAVAVAVVTIISGALVSYLQDPKNRTEIKKYAKQYKTKFQKTARKVKKAISKKVKEYKV